MFTEEVPGLGVIVTVTPKFDPQRMRSRYAYWIDQYADQMLIEVRDQIASAGLDPWDIGRGEARAKALLAFNPITMMAGVNWSAAIASPKAPTMMKTYGMMAGKLAIGIALPIVGIAIMAGEFLFGGKKKRMNIPWGSIYAQAADPAAQTTKEEEIARAASEVVQIAEIKQKVGEQRSAEASLFKMPEGILSISKGGALVIGPVGAAVEKRIIGKK